MRMLMPFFLLGSINSMVDAASLIQFFSTYGWKTFEMIPVDALLGIFLCELSCSIISYRVLKLVLPTGPLADGYQELANGPAQAGRPGRPLGGAGPGGVVPQQPAWKPFQGTARSPEGSESYSFSPPRRCWRSMGFSFGAEVDQLIAVSSLRGFSKLDENVEALNVNLGVLGHIDSGKTSICRMLSTEVTSTASMDKSRESQERGITLDLGFSSFVTDAPEHIQAAGYEAIQWCLVDCPGHASLIRTVIGGAQIIDLCALVIDVNKGIQTQTAECMVVAEILANQLVVILNKVDMVPADKRKKILDKVIKELRKTFARTKFGENLPFACVSAHPQDGSDPIGSDELITVIKNTLAIPQRDPSGPFMFAFDHAFAIKGQGTVLTGTVLSGTVKPQMGIVVPQVGEAGKNKKVRSLQMFRQPVQQAIQGDRVAMCVAALDAKDLERGIVLGEKFPVPLLDAAVCVVDKISYFKSTATTKSKFHVTLGHQTVMATAHFFCPFPSSSRSAGTQEPAQDKPKDVKGGYPSAGSGGPTLAMGCGAAVSERQSGWPTSFDFSQAYLHVEELWQWMP
ncbi:unnamed protein product, partial [Effrenium voratum]